jgi:UDP-N-acetylglucosamine 1-carboxyvinyltransferase
MRASSLVLGPLVARCGRARFRAGRLRYRRASINLHVGTGTSGAKSRDHGYVEASADRLKGGEILFDRITVTSTETCFRRHLAEGENDTIAPANPKSPTGRPAQQNGSQVEGAGTSAIRVKGVSKLHSAKHRIIRTGSIRDLSPEP